MASTANLRGTKLEVGQAQKEATLNGLADLFDAAIAGKFPVAITTADVPLAGTPASPQAQNKFFDLSGTLTGNRSLVFPVNDDDPVTGNPRTIYVKNGTAGAFTVTVKVSGQTGVTVTQGTTAILLHNGTDFVRLYEVNHTTGLISIGVMPAVVGASAYHNADQSIADNTLTVVALNSERWDTDTIHDTATNNSRLTCKTAGKYQITFTGLFGVHATGERGLFIRLNGTTYIAGDQRMSVTDGVDGAAATISRLYDLAVNDYVEGVVLQKSGGALNLLALGNRSPEFMMVRIGA